MDAKLLEYLTTPKMLSQADVINDALVKISQASTLMNTAIENNNFAVAGREAQKISDLVSLLKAAHKSLGAK